LGNFAKSSSVVGGSATLLMTKAVVNSTWWSWRL
jgi:hypothetical protein